MEDMCSVIKPFELAFARSANTIYLVSFVPADLLDHYYLLRYCTTCGGVQGHLVSNQPLQPHIIMRGLSLRFENECLGSARFRPLGSRNPSGVKLARSSFSAIFGKRVEATSIPSSEYHRGYLYVLENIG